MLLCLFVVEEFSECNLRLFGVTDTPTVIVYYIIAAAKRLGEKVRFGCALSNINELHGSNPLTYLSLAVQFHYLIAPVRIGREK